MISNAIEAAGINDVNSVSAQLGLTNLKAFRAARNAGATPADAVWQTPLGKSMHAMGYKNVIFTSSEYVKFTP